MAVARKQPTCPKCGELIKGIYANRGKTFVGDTFVRWDYESHKCPALSNGSMKFFIEHKETHLWFYPEWIPKFVNTFNGSRIRNGSTLKEGWTNDPNHKSIQHDSKEEAEKWIRIFNLENVEVTEHEFVDPSKET